MAIVRWDPFHEIDRLSRMLSADYFGRGTANAGEVRIRGNWVPPVDIYSNGNHEVVIKAELPDMKREEIDVTVENYTLTIRGEKKMEQSVNEEQFHRIERAYGTFSRSFSLPDTVDSAKVQADYKDGVLTITLPRREEAKPKQIKVNVAA